MNRIKTTILFFISLLYCAATHAATHTVTNTNDSGAGSLRQAILDANADGTTPRTINFAIGAGVQTIQPLTVLPDLTASDILIDGSTQPGWAAGSPVIILDGTSAAFAFDALTINATNNCTIQDLVINNGFNSGITIAGNASDNAIFGCFIGVDQTGAVASPNSLGITLSASAGQQNIRTAIGAPNRGNVVSGNAGFFGAGMFLSGNLTDMVIQGNFIGTDKTGTAAIANAQVGMAIISQPSSTALLCSGALIGGPNAGEANVISGNSAGPGLFMGFQNVQDTVIQGNKIGVDITGTVALPNGIGLVTFTDNPVTFINGTILGGANAGEGNVISANLGGGVGLQINCNDSVIKGNFIGTDITGTVALGNGSGISIQGNNNIIGGSTAAERNIISNNNGSGIVLDRSSSNNIITGNYIGVDITGAVAMGNTNNGVEINGYDFGALTPFPSNNNSIGGSLAGQRNIISNSGSSGILLNLGVNDTVIQNNYIGVDVTGTVDFGNNNVGVQVQGYDFTNQITVPSNRTIIGGATAGQGNIIAGNTNQGIQLNLGVNDSVIKGNKIGVDVTGLVAIANIQQGIQITGYDFTNKAIVASNSTIIGGQTSNERNIISGNGNNGIQLNLGVSDSVIQGNYIGVDATGLAGLSNGQQGILAFGFDFNPPETSAPSNNTIIGGSLAGQGNVISANLNSGIELGVDVNDTVIKGNYLGVGSDGVTPLGNINFGILVQGNILAASNGTVIGGPGANEGNVIGDNSVDGIWLNTNVNNSIVQGNFIGTDNSGTLDLGNDDDGIQISGQNGAPSTNNLIGGTAAAEKNIIKFNDTFGVTVGGNAATPDILNPILGNTIFLNANNGISLHDNGNNLQEPPTLSSAELCGTNDIVIVTATAPASPPASTFRLEFFLNSVDRNPITEGETFIGQASPIPSGGMVTLAFPASGATVGQWLSATATNFNNAGGTLGDTSEFSLNLEIIAATPALVDLSASPTVVCVGSSSTLTVVITGTGPYDLFWSDSFIQTDVNSPVERIVTPLVTTIYGVTIADDFGCTSTSNEVTVTVNPLPFVTLTASPESTFPGGTVTLTATPSGNGSFTLEWSDGLIQNNVVGPVMRNVIVNAPIVYSVRVTDSNGCIFGPVDVQIFTGRISPIVEAIINKYCPNL